ncbi:hypothetical protein EXIGLDRAFT_46296 [Exidia glandulosa HHB12029]|uniref:RNI-like protein n=1 Tax=Exidia glandulosa HHB12029 TaxID=1314781 RepID=A0A165P451_EXIGL|nr:hypothetical protein EXIGLDRAFT_46296 [Exidia glandulosa HHB12029]
MFDDFGGVRTGPMLGEYRASGPKYMPHETLVLKSRDEWNRNLLRRPGIRSITFSDSFICLHIAAIAATSYQFGRGLETFEVLGVGWQLRDFDVDLLVTACPNLKHITLDGCHNLTDASMFSIINRCHDLRFLSLGGRGGGRLRGAAFEHLAAHRNIVPRLAKIHFLDHTFHRDRMERAIKALSKARPFLPIVTGDSDEKEPMPFSVWRAGKMTMQFDLY